MAKKVFIAVGHGGKDSGAVGNGLKEKDLNLAMGLACNEVLTRHGVTTLMSRTKDENDDVNAEVRECNAFNPDLAVAMHTNAGGGDGCEAWYHYGGGVGKTLAQNILDAVVSTTGQNSRGAKTKKNAKGKDYYAFIRETKAPAVIFEAAFIDNKNDIAIIDTTAEQRLMGVAVAIGVLRALGIEYKPDTEERYIVRAGVFSVKANAENRVKQLRADGYNDAYYIVETN